MPSGRIRYTFEVTLPNVAAQPYWFAVAASNRNGTGPVSPPSSAVYEACGPQQFLALHEPTVANRVCRQCPTGAHCGGGSTADIVPRRGFYRMDGSANGLTFVPCEQEEACRGYDPAQHAGMNASTLAAAFAASGDQQQACAEGYSGRLCLRCSPGYARSGAAGCARCEDAGLVVLALAGTLLLALCILAYLTNISLQDTGDANSTALNKILLNHVQITSVALLFRLQWPTAIQRMLDAFNTVSSVSDSVISVECLLGGGLSAYRSSVILSLVTPVALLFILTVYWVVNYFTRIGQRIFALLPTALCGSFRVDPASLHGAQWVRANVDGWIVSAVVTAFMLHMSLAQTTLRLFTCEELDDTGRAFLVADPNVECSSASNQVWMWGVGLPAFFVYGVGIPLSASIILWLRRKRLDSPEVLGTFGFLYGGYTRKWYFWETIIMTRKAMLAFVAVFVQPLGLRMQVYCTMLVGLAALAAHDSAQPFARGAMNALERASIFVSLLTMLGGLFLEQDEVSGGARVVVTMCIVLVNAVLLLGLAVGLGHATVMEMFFPPAAGDTVKAAPSVPDDDSGGRDIASADVLDDAVEPVAPDAASADSGLPHDEAAGSETSALSHSARGGESARGSVAPETLDAATAVDDSEAVQGIPPSSALRGDSGEVSS